MRDSHQTQVKFANSLFIASQIRAIAIARGFINDGLKVVVF